MSRICHLLFLLVTISSVAACGNAGSAFPTPPTVLTTRPTNTPVATATSVQTVKPVTTPTPVPPASSLTNEQLSSQIETYDRILSWIDANCEPAIYRSVWLTRYPTDLLQHPDGGWYFSLSQIKRLSPGQLPWPGETGSMPGIWFEKESDEAQMHSGLADSCYDSGRHGVGVLSLDGESVETPVVETLEVPDNIIDSILWLEDDRFLIRSFDPSRLLAQLATPENAVPHKIYEVTRQGEEVLIKEVTTAIFGSSGECILVSSDASSGAGIWIVHFCPFQMSTVAHYDFNSYEQLSSVVIDNGLINVDIAVSQFGDTAWILAFDPSADDSESTAVFPLGSDHRIESLRFPDEPASLAISPDGKKLAVIHSIPIDTGFEQSDAFRRWKLVVHDLSSGEEATLLAGFSGDRRSLHWSHTGAKLFAVSSNSFEDSYRIDLNTEQVYQFSIDSEVIDISPDGRYALAAGASAGILSIHSLEESSVE